MGRYAFFSTGFEYKFAFGIQNSEDILKFSGFQTTEITMKWVNTDADFILKRLHQIETVFGWPEFDFSEFPKDVDGTGDIYSIDLRPLLEKCTNSTYVYQYLLGLCIYHQLQYTETLTCSFEW